MVAIASLLVLFFLSLVVSRIAAEALILTGLSRDAARFQARSAWTGTGYTTQEAESVVGHPVRRRIVSILMLLRGVGVPTAAAALVLSFVNVEEPGEGLFRFVWLVAGLLLFWFFARSAWIDQMMSRAIAAALKRLTDIDVHDYAGLLHLAGEYAIMELRAKPGHWLVGRTLEELRLPEEGVLVLGIVRPDGAYIGAPRGGARVESGDTLILYGRSPELASLDRRRADAAGDAERQRAVAEQKSVAQAESEAAGTST